jgi:PTH1 family peptidyl-tRNA hydrolase
MKAIVGLGNPGREYAGTRHNIGFAVIDELARRGSISFDAAPADALIARWRACDTMLAKPMTFMNLSGQAVGELLRYFKIDVPLGKLRARARGSAGGHNGLKSVIEHLGSDFARLRIGVGRGDDRRDLADHVLARFEKAEADEVARMTARAADAAETFIASGIGAVMNGFNGGDPVTTE